jgi:hypothetical protein
MQDPTEVMVPGQGHIYSAPAGTAMPPDLTTVPPVAWHDHGFTTVDGVTFSFGVTTADVLAWQSLTPLRTTITERPMTVKFDFNQIDAANFLIALGGGTLEKVLGPPAFTRYHPPDPSVVDVRALVIDVIDGGIQLRFEIYQAMLSAAVAMQWHRADAAKVPIEMKLMKSMPDTFNIIMPSGTRWDGTGTLLAAQAEYIPPEEPGAEYISPTEAAAEEPAA